MQTRGTPRLLILCLLCALGAWLFWLYGLGWLAQGLVHRGALEKSDILVIENFDPDYLLFEKARELMAQGWAARVLVPVESSSDPVKPGAVSQGIAELMARIARLPDLELLPVQQAEPISLSVARLVRDKLVSEGAHSVIVVSPGFRSKRSFLVWDSVLRPVGIRVAVVPVFGRKTPQNWQETWHGRQEVVLQWLKLLNYRLAVL